MLDELEKELRGNDSITREGYHQVRLLAATQGQLRVALAALHSARLGRRGAVGPGRAKEKRGWAATVLVRVIAWALFAVRFTLKSGWRYAIGALRAFGRS